MENKPTGHCPAFTAQHRLVGRVETARGYRALAAEIERLVKEIGA